MKAAVVERPGVLVVKEVDTPEISGDEVLLKVQAASICNATDNHILHGVFEGYHDYYPQILGHEVSGEVVEKGVNVENLQIGDRIVLYTKKGAFCEYITVNPSKQLFAKIPDSIPPKVAAICEMFHGAFCGVVYPADIQKTENVLVVGQGPMGLTVTACARLYAKTVSTVDLYDSRLEKSKEMGADYVYNRSRLTADEIVAEIEKNTGPVDLVIMCIAEDRTKELDAFDMGVKALKKDGRMTGLIVDVKDIGKNHRMDAHALIKKNIKFKHMLERYGYEGNTFQTAVDLLAEGKIDMAKLITHEVKLHELEYALELCENRLDQVIKVVVYPQ